MKLLLCGSHGTGKSTLLLKAQETGILDDFYVSDSVSAKFFNDKDEFKQRNATLVQKQRNFSNYQINIFTGNTDQGVVENVASSRSFADIWAYTKHLYEQTHDPDYLEQMQIIMNHASKSPCVYVYFPIMFGIEATKLRSGDLLFQRTIDDNINQFFDQTKLPRHIIKDVDLDMRLQQLQQIIKEQN